MTDNELIKGLSDHFKSHGASQISDNTADRLKGIVLVLIRNETNRLLREYNRNNAQGWLNQFKERCKMGGIVEGIEGFKGIDTYTITKRPIPDSQGGVIEEMISSILASKKTGETEGYLKEAVDNPTDKELIKGLSDYFKSHDTSQISDNTKDRLKGIVLQLIYNEAIRLLREYNINTAQGWLNLFKERYKTGGIVAGIERFRSMDSYTITKRPIPDSQGGVIEEMISSILASKKTGETEDYLQEAANNQMALSVREPGSEGRALKPEQSRIVGQPSLEMEHSTQQQHPISETSKNQSVSSKSTSRKEQNTSSESQLDLASIIGAYSKLSESDRANLAMGKEQNASSKGDANTQEISVSLEGLAKKEKEPVEPTEEQSTSIISSQKVNLESLHLRDRTAKSASLPSGQSLGRLMEPNLPGHYTPSKRKDSHKTDRRPPKKRFRKSQKTSHG